MKRRNLEHRRSGALEFAVVLLMATGCYSSGSEPKVDDSGMARPPDAGDAGCGSAGNCKPIARECVGRKPGRAFCVNRATKRTCDDPFGFVDELCVGDTRCSEDEAAACSCPSGAVEEAPGVCSGTVVVAAFHSPPRSLTYDHGELFWTDSMGVFRVSEDGGVPATLHAGEDCGALYGFAVDATALYVGACDQGLVARARADGSTRRVAMQGGLDVVKVGRELFWTGCGAGVRRVSVQGGDAVDLDIEAGCAESIDVSGSRLIVQEAMFYPDKGDAIAVSASLSGDSQVELGRGKVVATDDEFVFLWQTDCVDLDDCAVRFEQIVAVPNRGGAAIPLVRGQSTDHKLAGAASDGRFLYVAEASPYVGNQSSLFRVPVGGGSRETLVDELNWPGAVALGEGAIYFWDADDRGPDGHIIKLYYHSEQ